MERYTEAIHKAFSDLKQLWKDHNIPEEHMEIMTKVFSKENNPMKILEDIKSEFSEISKETSFIQKVIAAVLPREECVNKIKDLCSRVIDEQSLATNRNEF
jgi:Mg-chelatase subunit ChlI